MKRVFVAACLVASSFFPVLSVAQTTTASRKSVDEMPPIILSGLQAYKEKGPDEAVRAWIKGSGIDGTTNALTQANNLRQVEDFYGKYRDFEIISINEITPKTKAVYLVMDYEKGPLFVKFVVYRPDQAWILAYFSFNTKEESILPAATHER